MRPEDLRFQRLVWNLGRVARGARPGGFQYTEVFLRPLFSQADLRADEVEIISHFPLLPPLPWRPGWRVSYYIDATLRQNFVDYGLADRVSRKVREEALRREAEHYHAAERVVCMSRWAANSVVEDYGIPSSKVHAILPGANLRDSDVGSSTDQAEPPPLSSLRLGFIGKDWRRKGLPFLLQVAEELARRKVGVRVVALGPPAADLPSHPLLECAGFIDKQRDARRFVQLVRSCHFGCLFSSVEACGIASLECLRLGVPVLASRVGGIPDTVRDGLAYLFEPGCAPDRVADLLQSFVAMPERYWQLRARVVARAEQFSWRRTVQSFIALWQGSDAFQFRTQTQQSRSTGVRRRSRMGPIMYPTKRTEFVVAFNGARDAYQVALALHERGLLSKLVTDFYTPAPMARLGRRVPRLEKLAHRNAPGLPFSKVRWNASLIDHQYVRALLPLGGYSHHRPRPNLQSVLSRAALRTAEIRRANLLCYAGYAHQAFGSPRSQLMCKGLFQYHPHVDLSSFILSRDLEQHHKLTSSLVQLASAKSDITNLHELHQADFILCASSF